MSSYKTFVKNLASRWNPDIESQVDEKTADYRDGLAVGESAIYHEAVDFLASLNKKKEKSCAVATATYPTTI